MNEKNSASMPTSVSSSSPLVRRTIRPCQVCNGPAIYSYLGVIACPSCKMFFKRNVFNNKLKCFYNDHCEITEKTRHHCAACRLAKCFTSGMKCVGFRNSNKKKNRNKVTVASTTSLTTVNRLQQISTLNLLRSDQSALTRDQWTLLSNLIHCYDEYSQFSIAQQYLREQVQFPTRMRFKLASISTLYRSIMAGTQLIFGKNRDFTTLPVHDRSMLLQNTMKLVGGLAMSFIPVKCNLFAHEGFEENCKVQCGPIIASNSLKATKMLDPDMIFVKLVFSILIFSTFDYVRFTGQPADYIRNVGAILSVQDQYVELAWRYLIYKYDHQRAVLCFSNLIRCLFLLNESIVVGIEEYDYHRLANDLAQQTEQKLVLTG